jgi:hypothetical protein
MLNQSFNKKSARVWLNLVIQEGADFCPLMRGVLPGFLWPPPAACLRQAAGLLPLRGSKPQEGPRAARAAGQTKSGKVSLCCYIKIWAAWLEI